MNEKRKENVHQVGESARIHARAMIFRCLKAYEDFMQKEIGLRSSTASALFTVLCFNLSFQAFVAISAKKNSHPKPPLLYIKKSHEWKRWLFRKRENSSFPVPQMHSWHISHQAEAPNSRERKKLAQNIWIIKIYFRVEISTLEECFLGCAGNAFLE